MQILKYLLLRGARHAWSKAPEVVLTEAERNELQRLVRAHTTGQHLVLRARIVLLAGEGLSTEAIARHLQVEADTVRQWRIDTFDELTVWTYANRYILPLSCEQRKLFRIAVECNTQGTYPTTTPYLTAVPTLTATAPATSESTAAVIAPTLTITPSLTPFPGLEVGESDGSPRTASTKAICKFEIAPARIRDSSEFKLLLVFS